MPIRVFVYEYLTSGAVSGLPDSLAREGRAMLAAVVADLRRCEGVEVVSERAGSVSDGWMKESVADASGSSEASFRAAARRADFALVIAPEFDDILARRCEWAEREGCRLLGPSVGAVRLTADKLALSEHLARAGVPTIPTVPFTRTPPWPPPCVCKPRYGAGSQDTFLVRHLADFPSRPDTIVQPYLVPRHGPLSLACIGRTPLALMRQTLSGDGRFRYFGGERASDVDDAPYRELARAAIDAVPDLAGYFGLDLLWPEGAGRPVVVEINPRLTTSYVALRALCEGNLMRTLLFDEPPVFRAGPVRFSLEELRTE
jgi:predicted ATP-grasp superfamily ATP-dependent carboligase